MCKVSNVVSVGQWIYFSRSLGQCDPPSPFCSLLLGMLLAGRQCEDTNCHITQDHCNKPEGASFLVSNRLLLYLSFVQLFLSLESLVLIFIMTSCNYQR